MKNLKYILTTFALFVILISCNKDAVMPSINSSDIGSVDAAFSSSVLVYALTEADNGQLRVKIQRGNAQSAAIVPITVSGTGTSQFTLQSNTVQFAAGEFIKDIIFTYSLGSVAPAVKYIFTVTISDETMVSKSKASAIRVEAELPLDYVSLGNGTFSSEFFGESWSQPVMVATITPTYKFYKLPSCYFHVPSDPAKEGYDISFSVKDGVMTMVEQNTGYYYDATNGYISINPVTTVISGNKFTINATFHLRTSGAWFGAATSAESITLP